MLKTSKTISKPSKNFGPTSNAAPLPPIRLSRRAAIFSRSIIELFALLSLGSVFLPIRTIYTVSFTWFDAFKNKQKASQQNIHLEKAAVLFNLGAVHSQMGLSFDRSGVDGSKQASHAFIAAAGAFAFLRDNVAVKASMGSSTTVDVSVECGGMLERLMLAQAQECVFENTIAKGNTPGFCAKIS